MVDWLNLRIEGLGKMLILSFSCGVVLVRSVTDVILDCFVGRTPGLLPQPILGSNRRTTSHTVECRRLPLSHRPLLEVVMRPSAMTPCQR